MSVHFTHARRWEKTEIYLFQLGKNATVSGILLIASRSS